MNPLPAESLATRFEPVSLDELERETALRDRLDFKYIVPAETFERLADELLGTHRVLEVEGRRVFRYETVYFDSASLQSYRDHVQGRRRRYKTRSRHYVEADRYQFEVKLKGARGQTLKRRLERDAALHEAFDPEARSFLGQALGELYGREPTESLEPTLHTDYRRLTFVRRSGGQKLTCDFDLSLHAPDGRAARLRADHVILESKAEGGLGDADHLLRRLGARPVGCSKYCLGIAMTSDEVKTNQFRRLLRRYFAVDGGGGAGAKAESSPPLTAAR